jgi:hypothetical protein
MKLLNKPFGTLAGVLGGVRAVVDRAGAVGYERLTGVWPGDTSPTQ